MGAPRAERDTVHQKQRPASSSAGVSAQTAAEVQAQFAARLAADLKDKLNSYEDTDMSKVLSDSYAEERTRFTTFSSTAASFDSE